MLVSVIVTVYDTEKYLRKCLDSVIYQTLRDLEVIIINDGSPDNSGVIIEEYEKKDSRIRSITTINQGVSKARNLGIDEAQGKYIYFLDSDDYLDLDMLDIMVKELEEYGCDMSVCNIKRVFDDHIEYSYFKMPREKVIDVQKDNCRFIVDLLGEKKHLGGFCTNKLFKAETIRDSEIRFKDREDIYAEDANFFFKILKFIKYICVIDKPLFNYYQRENSVSHTYKNNLPERVERFIIDVSRNYYDIKASSKINKALKARTFTFFIEILENEILNNCTFDTFKRILRIKFYKDQIRGINLKGFSKNRRLIYFLYRYRYFIPLYNLFKVNHGKTKEDHIIKTIWNRKVFIILMTLFITTCSVAYSGIINYNKVTMTLRLNYYGNEKGLNPDGSRFNIFDITSYEVLDKTIANEDLHGLTVDDLKSRIDIYARATGSESKKVKSAIIAGKDYSYIPNEYTISYSQKDKLSPNLTSTVLKSLAETYKEYFLEHYTEKNYVLDYDKMDFQKYEYLEIADILSYKVTSMITYLENHSSENSIFRASSTGQTFENIIAMLKNLQSSELESFKGFVVSSSLAKDNYAYVNKLNYVIKTLDFSHSKKQYEFDFINEAIKKYNPNVTEVAFIPSLDSENEFYMSRTKIGIDYLTNNAHNVALAKGNIMKSLDYNKYLVDVYTKNKLTDADRLNLTNAANSMIDKIENKLIQVSDTAKKTDDDYLEYKTKDYLAFSIPYNNFGISTTKTLRIAIITLLLSCIYVAVTSKYKEWRSCER